MLLLYQGEEAGTKMESPPVSEREVNGCFELKKKQEEMFVRSTAHYRFYISIGFSHPQPLSRKSIRNNKPFAMRLPSVI